MIVKLLVDGGEMTPGPVLAQKLGPLGMNIGEIISKVNKATDSFKGTKVPVELDINTSTKEFKIKVSSPPIPELIKKELKIEKGSGDQKNVLAGNISIEQIISIAKTKLPEMLEKNLKSAVKTIAGSCVSLGVLIDSKSAKEVAKEIAEGKYDKEIQQEKTSPSPEKKAELEDFFKELNEKQQAALKQKEEAAKEEESKTPGEKESSVKEEAEKKKEPAEKKKK